MSPKKRRNRRRSKRRQANTPAETRTAEAVTVAWMLTAVATLLAEVAAVVGFALLLWFAEPDAKKINMLKVLPGLLLLIGSVTGIICLVLTVVANRVRQIRPPRSVTIFAVVVGIAPMLTWLVLTLVAA